MRPLSGRAAVDLAEEIRRRYPSIRVDAVRPEHEDSDGWVIYLHHLGYLGSFTIASRAEWAEKARSLR